LQQLKNNSALRGS